jgi:predicted ATPase
VEPLEAGYAEHLSTDGDNLVQVAQYLFENHGHVFVKMLAAMRNRVPGVSKVEAHSLEDGSLVLRFQDGSFKDPFVDRFVSDGAIKMFAYLVLLYDPRPHPLLCVEEPENQLYPALLGELAEEFRAYSRKRKGGGQVLVSTHSPDFLNAVNLDEVYWLAKGEDGYTTAQRASDVDLIRSLVREGDKMGWLWKQGFFTGADPR